MGPLYVHDIHSFEGATAAFQYLWCKTASFVCDAAVVQLPPFQHHSPSVNTNNLVFLWRLVWACYQANAHQWLSSCLTMVFVAAGNTTCTFEVVQILLNLVWRYPMYWWYPYLLDGVEVWTLSPSFSVFQVVLIKIYIFKLTLENSTSDHVCSPLKGEKVLL